MFFMPKTPKT